MILRELIRKIIILRVFKEMNVLITGANGFIGKHLQKLLLNNKNIKLFLLLRDKKKNNKNDANIFYADFEKKIIDWDIFLKNIDVVIHLAARQHKMGYKNDSNKYNQINSDLVKEIIERSEANNVKKFIYLSSARVYEELLHPFKSYSVSDKINPIDLYSKSKYSGEIELNKKIKENKIQIYILRIPLVYGGNPKGYLSLFNNLNKFNIPLPIKCFKDNLRSFLSIYNLVYFIEYLIFLIKIIQVLIFYVMQKIYQLMNF